MALDERMEKAVMDTCGRNVYQQIVHVVPEFFDRFMLIRMTPKPEDLQGLHYPHVIDLDERIVVSADGSYLAGEIIHLQDRLGELCQRGLYVLVSPPAIRNPRFSTLDTDDLLQRMPYDSLVIAEALQQDAPHFGKPDVFYAHNARLGGGRKINYGKLSLPDVSEGICRHYVHFAFVPEIVGKRRDCTFLERL